jgi:hypothetical protein
VTRSPTVIDGFTLKAKPTTKRDGSALQRPPEQTKSSVYATFWQARSGFFNTPRKPPVGRRRYP